MCLIAWNLGVKLVIPYAYSGYLYQTIKDVSGEDHYHLRVGYVSLSTLQTQKADSGNAESKNGIASIAEKMNAVTLLERQRWSIDLIGSQVSETALLRIFPTTSQFTHPSTHHDSHASIFHTFKICSHWYIKNEHLSSL